MSKQPQRADICTCREPLLDSDVFPSDVDDDGTDFCLRCRRPVLEPEGDE